MNCHYCGLGLLVFALFLAFEEAGAAVNRKLEHAQDQCTAKQHLIETLLSVKNYSSVSHSSKLLPMAFLIEEPEVCALTRPNVSLLIYVHSSPFHFKNRAQIRQTYGSSALYHELGIVTLFLIGRSEDREVDRAVRLESYRYHDIIMADYHDGYQNLTLKAISALTWIARHCKQAPYVLKTDDDVLVNVFNVVRHVKYLAKYEIDSLATGHIHCNVKNATDISKEDVANFPEHCSSSAFLMPGSLVPILHGAIPRVPYLTLDNVYVTGLLRVATGITELNNIASVVVDALEEYVSNKDFINENGLFGRLNGDKGLELMKDYWDDILLKHQGEEYQSL